MNGPAERLVLTEDAEAARTNLRASVRLDVDHALRSIKNSPGWTPGRHVAPADAPYPGAIVDLTVQGIAIVYRIRGDTVEVLVIRPVLF